jgi:hypothetical protein
VSVVRLIVATRSSSILISGKIIKEMPASVASGTPCISDIFSTGNRNTSFMFNEYFFPKNMAFMR